MLIVLAFLDVPVVPHLAAISARAGARLLLDLREPAKPLLHHHVAGPRHRRRQLLQHGLLIIAVPAAIATHAGAPANIPGLPVSPADLPRTLALVPQLPARRGQGRLQGPQRVQSVVTILTARNITHAAGLRTQILIPLVGVRDLLGAEAPGVDRLAGAGGARVLVRGGGELLLVVVAPADVWAYATGPGADPPGHGVAAAVL
mmetsp:Transcript_41960/g.95608  ORF Transcript_41960/g.95608 Transcript_41960/m.95608 type:complete len:203 (+) Transcript_41960:256-864(+)